MAAISETEAGNHAILDKLHGIHSQHLKKTAMLSEDLVVDKRADDTIWEYIKVGFLPLGPKHVLGFEKPGAARTLRKLQEAWGLSEKAFPAMIFVLKGTSAESWRPEFAMVEPEYFSRSREMLETNIRQARAFVDQKLEQSLELVYVAITGERPPGSDSPPPLMHIPG